MIINQIQLKNYRNYESQDVVFDKGLNVIFGKNAQGKTNLLEAIFLCAVGKSVRTSKDKDLIKWNNDMAVINLQYNKNSGNKKISVYLQNNQNKTIKINSVPIKRIGELMGEFNAIYFSPDELKLVKESPDERRRFIDISLSQFNKNYFYTLSKYNKILAQRNKLLKTSSNNQKTLQDTLSIWNEELATAGEYIIKERLKFIEKLKVYANESIMYLTNNKENMVLEYSKSFQIYTAIKPNNEDLTDKNLANNNNNNNNNNNSSSSSSSNNNDYENNDLNIKENLLKAYASSLQKDINLGYTTVGPHRDDFKIIVNNIDVRYFGSQGQQRTCALSLKLAELEIFKQNIGEYPVLLLDDVLSELDIHRQQQLLEKVSGIQTIITGTSFDFKIPYNAIYVENGKVLKNKSV